MPYIGNQHNVGDHVNNFKVLDDISSHTATFDGSATSIISAADDTIRIPEHRFIQGQRVTYTNGGGGNIGGLTSGTAYFISFDTANTIKLATTLANANSNTVINLTAVGSGTSHTLNAAFDGVNTKFKMTHSSGKAARLNNATQINVAINNVIQRPNVNSVTFTEGFALEDNHKIVFKTAPTVNDIFWGSIIANTIENFDLRDNEVDNFTGDASTTEFTLSTIPANNESVVVTIDGVLQHPSDKNTTRAYTLIDSIIQFTAAPALNAEIQVRHIGFAGSSTNDVSGFYGRTGNVALTSSDHITTGDITSRNINSSGIITATTFSGGFSGNVVGTSATFTGNLSVGGVLTYEDVTNVDSVGIITAQKDIHVGAGVSAVGIVTAAAVDVDDFLDVGSNIKLGNAGVITATTFSGSGASLTSIANANISNSAAIAGSKITPNFGSQTLTAGLGYFTNNLNTTGIFSLTGGTANINFNRASHTPTYRIRLTGGSNPTMNFRIQDTTNTVDRFIIRHGGQIEIPGDVGIGHPVNFSTTNISKFGSYSTLHIKGPSNEGAAIRLQDNGDTADSDDFVIYKNNAGAYLRVNGTDPLIAYMNGGERFRIDSSGNVNISKDLNVDGHTNLDNTNIVGVATVSTRLNINTVSGTRLAVAGTNYAWRGMFMIKDTTTGSGAQPYMTFWDGSEANDGSNTGLLGRAGHVNGGNVNERFDFWTYRSTTPLSLGTNGNERLRIDTGGRVLIGTPVAAAGLQSQEVYGTSALQIQGTSGATSSISLLRHGNSPYLTLGSTGGSALNAVTALSDDDRIGQITFAGADGTDVNTHAASIAAYVDGSVSSNTVPGRITFQTSTGASEITRMTIGSTGNITIGTAAAAGGKLYFESTSGAAQYIASGGTNNRDLIFGSSSGTKLTIDEDGSVLIIGNSSFTPVDSRNVGGIHIRDNRGISFKAFSGSTASRNWRIRNDDLTNFGDLNISVGNNNTTDIPDATSELVMTFTKERNVIIGDAAYGSSLGQLRIINNATTAPASLSLFGIDNTTTGDVFAKIDFASQENSTNGQVTAGIEAQAVGTAERAADLVFKTRPDTSGSSAIERVRMASDGTTTISGVPAYGAISKTASSSTYVDIFVYDTRKDSDGGAWRHRTNNTSWYNETLNTSIRGARREFPQVAIIAAGASFLQIFDADDPDVPMWMEFPTPGGTRNVMYGTGNPRCVYMLNGILCTGSQAANYWPVLIDFIRDDILGLRSATGHNHYHGRQGNISLRNSATSDNAYWWPDTVANGASQNGRIAKRWWFDGTIVNKFVTSVVMDVRPEAPIDKTTGMQIPTIYLGTRGGVSVIHSNSGDNGTSYNSSVYDITSNNGPYSGVGDITITDDGYLWTLHDFYNYNSDGGYNFYRDSSAIDLKRLDNQMNNMTHSPSADSLSSLNNQGGGSANKGREYYWPSTGAEAGTHRIGYSNTWAATIIERDAWGSPSGLAFVKRGIYTYDHKESSSFLARSHQNRGLVAMITKDYNTGWHMTGSTISSCYITQGLTSNISAGSAAMLDFGYHLRNLDVVGTLTRAKCATGSDLSCVSGFSSSNYARIINASLNAGNPINMTLMGWIKLTDISGYSYLCSIGTGSANMGIAVHASDSSNGGKPYFYDSTHGSLQGDKGINDGEWHHVCGVFSCSSNRKILYVDGVRSGGTTAPSNVNYSDLDTIAVGHWCGANGTEVNHSCTGSLALVKLGQTDLTDQQIKRIYEDEKKLFQPNAKAFLYGSSNGVTAIGYDEKKEIYHVGTSSGRSDFSGLSRINNTTTAVTTAISAYDGLIAEQ